jgi:RpiR family transcriptional regulator, carbohydrate utilization regulator
VGSRAVSSKTFVAERGSLAVITNALPALNDTMKKTAKFILANPRETINLTITELSKRIGTSDASIVRFCQTIGYSGFHALKLALAEDIVSPLQLVHEDADETDTAEDVLPKIFKAGMRSLEDTLKILDPAQLRRAVEALIAAKTIEIFASGNSVPLALDLNFRLTKIGLLSRFSLEPTFQEMSASLMQKGSVAIGISHLGSSKDTVHAMQLAQDAGATTLCITNHSDSPITHVSQIQLFTASHESFFREEEMGSRLAALAIIEALYVGVCVERYEASLAASRKTLSATKDRKF